MKEIKATIITIGDELLIGQVVDTNSSWMAQRLNEIGIEVRKRVAIGDSANEIIHVLDAESGHSDIILITGGLGPTSDDITKQVLCEYFGGKMVVNEEARNHVIHLFEMVFKKAISPVNLLQAEVPDVCTVFQNKRGSAPGMLFKKENTIFISMPGVPYEMEGIMNEVLPYLQQKFDLPVIIHRTILTAGIGESALAEILEDFEKHIPAGIRLAYLPAYGMVRLRLSASGFDRVSILNKIESYFNHLKILVKDYLVTDKDESLPVVVGRLLKEKNKTIATVESCTGGTIASLLTSVAGSSAYYEGSVVSYSYEVKENLLGVNKDTLLNFGAVSEETVIEMLQRLLQKINADFGIAVSGIMGPGGGLPEKPVGTVWIAVGNKNKYLTQKFQLRFERIKNIEVTTLMALEMMRKFILSNG